ncbi:MAG TPA: hypothetical protein VMB53_16080 [Gaiellaceae bacterium]|nr:hypothetical protein [Gaiellaceae bacterium]HVM56012.1 hypothetical protein [Gaiellaceae bacterium]
MSTHDDENIHFDFFDEPETQEASPRRGLGGRGSGGGDGPNRPRQSTGVVPLVRLAGLVAIAIVLVVVLVSWISSCQGQSKQAEYQSYMDKVSGIARSDRQLGASFANKLAAAGTLKQSQIETALEQYAQQEQQAYDEAQRIRPPGPLRSIHQNLINAVTLRAKGLAGLANAFADPASMRDATTAANALTAQAALLSASDVVWEQLFRLPATQQLKAVGVTGVVVPKSVFVTNPDLVSARAFTIVYNNLHGASTGGTPSGKHGDQIVSTRAIPQGVDLSTTSPTTVKVSSDLSFQVTIENSGDFQEVNVPVTLTIAAGSGSPIVCHKRVLVIQPAQQRSVTCGNLQLPTSAFGSKVTITAYVGAVAGEINTANNKAVYPVFFTLG